MIRRSTWILLAVLAVVAALAWYLELSPAGQVHQTPALTQTAKLLPDFDPILMTKITFRGKDGRELSVRIGAESKYEFGDQNGKEVNQGAVYQLASELAALEITSTIQSTTSPESMGLDNPALVISVENARGEKHEVKVGRENPIGSGYYVQLDQHVPAVVGKAGMEQILSLSTIDALAEPSATQTQGTSMP